MAHSRTVKRYTIFVAGILAASLLWSWTPLVAGLVFLSDWSVPQIGEVFLYEISRIRLGVFLFLYAVLPGALIHHFLTRELKPQYTALVWAAIGEGLSLIYALQIFSFSFPPQFFIHAIAGILAGLIIWGFEQLALDPRFGPDKDQEKVSATRRTLVLSSGGIGTAALIGSLIPIGNVLRNTSRYVDVSLSKMEDNQILVVEVENLPVWILKRAEHVVALLDKENPNLLDPNSENSIQPLSAKNRHRSIHPRYFIAYGVCTHMGCSPKFSPEGGGAASKYKDDPQFFCPCHGSVYDLAGRVYKNVPAPRNLNVPNYELLDGDRARIYFPSLKQKWSA